MKEKESATMNNASKCTGAPWQWLEERNHPWRRQLSIKGRKLLASAVWMDAQANGLSVQEAAEDWDLPEAVVHEAFEYTQLNLALIANEAQEEMRLLQARAA